MPTYEYKCDACGAAFERFQSMSAPAVKRCPECGKAKVRRLIGTGAGLIFKGSGFYITDYRDQSYTDKAKAESGDKGGSGGADGGASSEGKSDAKSDSKADGKPAETTSAAAKSESKSDSKTPAPAPKKESKSPKKKSAD